jgi:hypothetical protein
MRVRATCRAASCSAWPAVAAAALAFNVSSGKLSDLAINFLLPLLTVASLEWLLAVAALLRGRRRRLTLRETRLACLFCGLYFAMLQLVPSFVEVHARIAAMLHMPLGGGRTFGRNVADLPDLLTLVTSLLAAAYMQAVNRPHRVSFVPWHGDTT